MANIGIVSLITGQAFLVDTQGVSRPLALGDNVGAGDTIVVPRGATVELQLANGNAVHIASQQTVTFTQELSDAILFNLVEPSDNAVSQSTIQSLMLAIDSGDNIDDIIKALAQQRTDANDGFIVEGAGHSFVDLLRVDELVAQFDYTYDVASREYLDRNPLQQDRDVQGGGLGRTVDVVRIDEDLGSFNFQFDRFSNRFEGRRDVDIQRNNDHTDNPTVVNGGGTNNIRPTATAGSVTGAEDAPSITIGLAGADADGTIASFHVTTLPPFSQGTLYLADGTTRVLTTTVLTPAQAAGLIFKPALNFNGTVNIPFTATDNGGAVSTPANIAITINAVPDAPIAISDVANINEDATNVPLNLLFNDSDPDGTTPTILSINGTLLTPGTAQSIAVYVGAVVVGTVSVSATGAIAFTPAPNFNGPINFPYVITDGVLPTASTVTVNVAPVPDAPLVASDDTKAVTEDTPATGNVLTDGIPDSSDGNPLTVTQFTINGINYTPSASAVSILGVGNLVLLTNGNYTFTPAPNYVGAVPVITYTVSDGTLTDTATLT